MWPSRPGQTKTVVDRPDHAFSVMDGDVRVAAAMAPAAAAFAIPARDRRTRRFSVSMSFLGSTGFGFGR